MSALTLAEAKTHLNITTEAEDAELQATIDAAEAAIEIRIGPIAARTVTSRISTPGPMLLLDVLPVLSLTSVTPAGASALDLTGVEVGPWDGVLEASYANPLAWTGYRDLTLVYIAGRDPVPADVLQAVKEMVRHLWSTQRGPTRRPGSAESALSNTIPGAAYTLPIRVTQLLQPHMLPGVA